MVGVFALAVGIFVAAFAISTYEAWWSLAFVIFGVILLASERSSLGRSDAARAAIGLIGSIVLGAAGLWMLLLSQFGNARPCDACFDNGILFVPGLGAFIVAIYIATVTLRSVARAFGPSADAPSARDIAER